MAKSRGAGAAQRGFEYDVYRKGGTVKKYASGGSMKSIPQSEEERKAEQPSYLYKKTPSRFEKMTSDNFTRVPSTLKGLGEDIRHVGGNLMNAAKAAAPTAAEKELARKRSTPSTGAFREGGKIKKYAEGGKVTEYGRSRGTESMPEGDVPQSSFSDLFGKKKKAPETKPTAVEEPALKMPKSEPVEKDLEVSRAQPGSNSAPPRPQRTAARRRRMNMRPRPSSSLPSDEDLAGNLPMARAYGAGSGREREAGAEERLHRLTRGYAPEVGLPYAKGGKVKMAGGGSCRGMGAATKGGKYTIK